VDEPYYNVSGDMHFEQVQYGLAVRYEDNQRCIEAIIKDTCENSACLGLLLTGDNFHKKALLPRVQILFTGLRSRLKAAGKQLLAIDGNHDGSDASWLDTIDSSTNANGRVIKLGSKDAAFFSYQPRAKLYEKVKQVSATAQVLVLHGHLLEMMTWAKAQKEPEYDFSAVELRDAGLKHCTVLMGDIHTYSDFYDPVGDNWFIYAGSTEMTEISEGNIVSEKSGNRYDTTKKYLRFYPERAHGQNWTTVDLPNRPFLKRVITTDEDMGLAIQSVDTWVAEHPKGILALHYPFTARDAFKDYFLKWKQQLLELFDVPLSTIVSKPLQEMKDIDILMIAEQELTGKQVDILRIVLTDTQFEKALKQQLCVANGQG
jgi:DNA repair exonuclease SbcCD nuclease subunit